MLNTLGSRCAHAHYTPWFLTFPGQKKSRILWESTPSFSRTNTHYKPQSPAPHAVCLCWILHCGSVKSVERTLRNTPVGLLNASEPFCSRCLWGSAVDWLHASFKSPPRVFNFKKTPEQFGVSPLTFCRRIKCLFFASGGAWDLAGLRTMLSVFV